MLFYRNISAQQVNATYVKALYKQYPTQKSDLCAGCKLWVNPYYRSIADTAAHRPFLTYYVYTKVHRLEQEALDLPREGIYAALHAAYGQPDETKLYQYANKNAADMIAKGNDLQKDFDQPIITKILSFQAFRLNEETYLDYYYKDPSKPFCQNIVNPKLKELIQRFHKYLSPEREAHRLVNKSLTFP